MEKKKDNMEEIFQAAWQVVHNRLKELPENGSLDPDVQALREFVDKQCDTLHQEMIQKGIKS